MFFFPFFLVRKVFIFMINLEQTVGLIQILFLSFHFLFQNQGKDIADSELLDYISESSTMSKSLAEYGEQKSCAVTTAKRLSDFLGDAMVKDKGLLCHYIVACEPSVCPLFYIKEHMNHGLFFILLCYPSSCHCCYMI